MIEQDTVQVLKAYIGPDVLMPVASALAAVVGIMMMFGRRTIGFFRGIGRGIARFARRLTGRPEPGA